MLSAKRGAAASCGALAPVGAFDVVGSSVLDLKGAGFLPRSVFPSLARVGASGLIVCLQISSQHYVNVPRSKINATDAFMSFSICVTQNNSFHLYCVICVSIKHNCALTCCRREFVGHGNSDRKMFSLFRCHDYFIFQVEILVSHTNVTFSPDYLVQS